MAGRVTRQDARERLDHVYQQLRDRYIPAEERQPVKDGKFWEWEEMADQFERELTAAFLEELAGLSTQAALAQSGVCPFCHSPNTKWLQEEGQRERQSKHGAVVLPRQVARCRSCDRSFSPTGTVLGSEPAGGSDSPGGGAGESGGGGITL